MKEINEKTTIKLQLYGWIFFVFCAFLFIASSIKNHDLITFIASLFFLFGCIFFIIPLVRTIFSSK